MGWLEVAKYFLLLIFKWGDAQIDAKKERKKKKLNALEKYKKGLKNRDRGAVTLALSRMRRIR